MRICGISRRGQPKICGPAAWDLGMGLATPHGKEIILFRYVTQCLKIGHNRTRTIPPRNQGEAGGKESRQTDHASSHPRREHYS
jgi:hypothetical protein